MIFDITIIIPAKDEEKRLPPFLASVINYCQQSRYRYEIIVVDDGSTDNTTQAAEAFKTTFPALSILTLPLNRGKGHAVKCGFLKAHGHIALFLDADGSTPVSEIERHLHFFDEGYDIVIGSRVLQDTSSSVKAKSYRKLMGLIFNRFVHTFLIKDIKDTQCGFKMFRHTTIHPIWDKVHLDGFGFDLEVLFLAQQLGFKIKEIPVNWIHVEGSKVSLLNDSIRMFINIFQIKQWHPKPSPAPRTQQ